MPSCLIGLNVYIDDFGTKAGQIPINKNCFAKAPSHHISYSKGLPKWSHHMLHKGTINQIRSHCLFLNCVSYCGPKML